MMEGVKGKLHIPHLQLEYEGLPSAIVPWCNSPALRCKAAKNMLCTVSHHEHAWSNLSSPASIMVLYEMKVNRHPCSAVTDR